MNMPEILEIIMIVCFGCSWPMNLMKSYKARTTKGKSLGFLCRFSSVISPVSPPSS